MIAKSLFLSWCRMLSNQVGIPHQEAIHFDCCSAALRDRMNDKGLTAMHVACCEYMRNAGPIPTGFRFNGLFPLNTEGLADVCSAARKARGGNQQLAGIQLPVSGRDPAQLTAFVRFQFCNTLPEHPRASGIRLLPGTVAHQPAHRCH